MFQIETLGFGFSKVFENDKIIKVENIQKFKSIYRGTCISNFGRVDFITFKNLNMEVGKNYFVNMKTDFFDGNIKLVIFDARQI